MAQRANISPTWYTWLEQGRGGAPSADVLDRIARALMLTDVEREHSSCSASAARPRCATRRAEGVTPRLQRVLDALELSPALVKTATWDVVAWNRAAAVVLTDYGALPPEQRNILRLIFCDPRVRAAQYDWESVARFVVARVPGRRGARRRRRDVADLVDELCRLSPEFAAMWRDNDVRAHGDGIKQLRHPVPGPIALRIFGLRRRRPARSRHGRLQSRDARGCRPDQDTARRARRLTEFASSRVNRI